jgi:peptidoglycan/LPS O-acetylase OafA/YrhL
MKPAHRRHREDRIAALDGLRALAALAVFGVHFNQIVRLDYRLGPFRIDTLLANGDHAVSMFFSLSGFLLSLPFWKSLANQTLFPDVRTYFLRRTARILPAYYVALTALIFIGSLWRTPEAHVDILLHYTFLFNFAEFSIFSINPPFWTLAVEIQFYLLLPCIFLLIRQYLARRPWVIIIFLVIGAYGLHCLLISSVSSIIPWPFNPWLTWIRPHGAVLSHSILSNLPHFLIGMAAAKLYLKLNQNIDSAHQLTRHTNESVFWICVLTLIFLLATGYVEKIEVPYAPYGLPVVPLLLAAIIFTAPITQIAKRILDGFVLRKLGAISYGIYIYHLPCLNTIDRYMATFGMDAAKHWAIFGLAGIVSSILISIVSFVVLEKPIMKFVRKKSMALTLNKGG